MAQPIAQGDGFTGKIYIDAGDGEGREGNTATISITCTDTDGVTPGTAVIQVSDLVGLAAAASVEGDTITLTLV